MKAYSVALLPSLLMLGPQCPSCGKHFAGEEINKELLHGEKVNLEPLANLREPLLPVRFDKEGETYEVAYRCKHCGHEWKDIVEKDL